MAMSDASRAQFSVAVVGLGMIGSAACRHLSLLSSEPTAIIGIGAIETGIQSSVFSSHYDQGRVTRIVDRDFVWSHLAAKSISSYESIERDSGISFHGPVGSIRVSPFYGAPGDGLAKAVEVGISNGADVKLVEDLSSDFPYFGFQHGDVAFVEYGGAGYVNPREMVKAQLAIARKNGVRLVHKTVTVIERVPDGGLKITTDAGNVFTAARILVCAGAYTNFLLPRRLRLAVKIKAVSILLAEVCPEQVKQLKGMPSFIWRLSGHPLLHSVYGCPPLKYPDGKTYLKIGGTEWEPKYISTQDEFLEWFRGPGSKTETDALLGVLLQLLPGLKFQSLKTKPCVVSYTPSNYPYVDQIDEDMFVATFGCGAAAKSSDEIGKMASLLVQNGRWAYPELNATLFGAVFASDEEDGGS